MSRRFYANAAPQLTLNGSVTATDTTLTISGSFSGWPSSTPFFAVLEYGQANMEIVLVTAIAGATATVSRGQSATVAVSHLAGATLDHGVVAQDMDDASGHAAASAAVHGVTGAVVGTVDTQTLSNKTLAGATLSGTTTATGDINAGTHNIIGGNLTAGGTLTATGAISGASLSGVLVPHAYATAAARDTALPTPTAGTVVWLTTPGALFQYDGANWKQLRAITDTGWQSPGLAATQPTGATVTAQRYRQINNVMWIYLAGALGATCAGHLNGAGSGGGDYANEVIVTTLGSAFQPAQYQPLSSGASGCNFSWTIATDGSLAINAGPASPVLTAAASWSVGGSYLLD